MRRAVALGVEIGIIIYFIFLTITMGLIFLISFPALFLDLDSSLEYFFGPVGLLIGVGASMGYIISERRNNILSYLVIILGLIPLITLVLNKTNVISATRDYGGGGFVDSLIGIPSIIFPIIFMIFFFNYGRLRKWQNKSYKWEFALSIIVPLAVGLFALLGFGFFATTVGSIFLITYIILLVVLLRRAKSPPSDLSSVKPIVEKENMILVNIIFILIILLFVVSTPIAVIDKVQCGTFLGISIDPPCLAKKSAKINNPELCEILETIGDKSQCYENYAIRTGDYTFCEKVGPSKGNCLVSISRSVKNPDICKLVPPNDIGSLSQREGCCINVHIDLAKGPREDLTQEQRLSCGLS